MIELSKDVLAFIKRRTADYGGEVRVVIYARKSRPSKKKYIQSAIDRFDSPLSIQLQLRDGENYAKAMGWTVIDSYSDIKTGTTHKRPGLIKMQEQIEKDSKICIILVHRLDRFARGRVFDYLQYGLWNRINPVLVLSITEPLDFSSISKFTTNVIKGVAELDVTKYVERSMEGALLRAEGARLCGGKPPYGYAVTPEGIYYKIPEQAEEIQYIFSAVADGIGYKEIIKHIYEVYGRKMSKATLVSYLKQEKYAGDYIYNKKGGKNRADRVLDKEYSEVRVDDGVPAIVSRELFLEVQEILNGRKGRGGKKTNRSVYPLNDKIFCRHCSRKLRGTRSSTSGHSKKPCERYECPQHKADFDKCPIKGVSRVPLENLVFDAVDIATATPAFKKAVFDAMQKKDAEIRKKIAKLEKDNSLLDNGIKQAISELLQSPLLRNEITEHVALRKTVIMTNEENIAKFKKRREKITALTAETIQIPSCKTMTHETQLILIDTFIDKIIVDNDNVEVVFNEN